MAARDVVIALGARDRQTRKLVRLVLAGDGSFGVTLPYCGATSAIVAKVRMQPLGMTSPWTGQGTVEVAHRTSSSIKLSVHRSGFVQFSAAGRTRMRSGLSPSFQIPKGLGLHSNPLTDPIETGPTWMAWFADPGQCRQLDPRNEPRRRILTFDEADLFERSAHDLRRKHFYWVEGFVIRAVERRYAEYVPSKGWVLNRPYAPSRPEWRVQMRVIDLPVPDYSLAVLISRLHVEPGTRQGYGMGGPRDLTHQFELIATFPAEAWAAADDVRALPSLEI